MNSRHHRWLVLGEHLIIRQILREASNIKRRTACHQQHQNGAYPQEISDKPYHKPGILPSDYSHDKGRNINCQPSNLLCRMATNWLSDQQMRQRQDGLHIFINLKHLHRKTRRK
ncbi:hypothetical protein BAA13334_I02508 [Brucella abortus A13334]|nr:hypothetical protein BAA13334_I02508 [Brucella abortus A13334]